jgi:hypothetical protein
MISKHVREGDGGASEGRKKRRRGEADHPGPRQVIESLRGADRAGLVVKCVKRYSHLDFYM